MTVSACFVQISQQLSAHFELEEARSITRWLLEFYTGCDYLTCTEGEKNSVISNLQISNVSNAVIRLLQNEPLQYVTGEAWFLGNKFFVNPAVLIPRPETEELVIWGLELLGNLNEPSLKAIDIGCGSGCIAISLALGNPKLDITAVDISKDAIQVAQANAERLNANIRWLAIDFLQPHLWTQTESYHLIIANPPYIPMAEKTLLAPQVRDFEPQKALFVPDNNPLIFFEMLADYAVNHLKKNGYLLVETHQYYAKAVCDCFNKKGYNTQLKKDLFNNDRMVAALKR